VRTGSRAALASVCAVLFLTFLDTTIVSVALASIQSRLHAGVSSLQWVVNGYALTFASFMLAAGALGDRIGRRRVMLGGVATFCAGSVLCALAPSVGWLIGGRAAMGLGAAASEPGTLSVLRHLFPDERDRARALGAWAAISGLAIALGPVIGGTLVGVSGWRAVFWFNLAAGVVIFTAALATVPESADPDSAARDPAGLVLGVVALTSLTFAVIDGESRGYTAGLIIALFAVGAVAAVAFAMVERRVAAPLIQPQVLRRKAFDGALWVAFAISFGLFAIFFFVALYLQLIGGYSGYRTALVFVPMAVVMVLGSAFTGRWVAAHGPAIPMTFGCLAGGAGMLLTEAVLQRHPSFAALAVVLALAGAGVGVALVPVTTVALAEVPARRSGMAASAANTSRELGAVFGVAALGAMVNAELASELSHRLRVLGLGSFQSFVIRAIETGGLPTQAPSADVKAYGQLVNKVIAAAYAAFRSGLDIALLTAGALVLAAAPVAWLTVRRRAPAAAAMEVDGEG
jgi:EmrB/QacA subfamily drug resistance transporter